MKKPQRKEAEKAINLVSVKFTRLGFQFVNSGQMLSFAGIVEIDGLKIYAVINSHKIFIAGQICIAHGLPAADLQRAVSVADAILFSCESEFNAMENVLNFDKREGALLSDEAGVDIFVEQISTTITNAQVPDFINDWAKAEIGKRYTYIYQHEGISVTPSPSISKELTDCYLNGFDRKYRAN